MKKIALIYWPKGGNVECTAKRIGEKFDAGQVDVYDAASIQVTELANYDALILGGSTAGAEHWTNATDQNKWNRLFKELSPAAIKDKPTAIFGLGDQLLYPRHFVDEMAVLKNEFEKMGARMVGQWPIDGYQFTESKAVQKGHFFGLALDEDRQPELSDARITTWVANLKKDFSL